MRELLPLLSRPARWLGIEEGASHKKLPVKTHIGLAFPDLYEVGMSYLGLKILYALLNAYDDRAAERVFAPCRETGAILRGRGAPLCTLESDTPLHRLDILGFSVTHELCYTNILYMLDLGGLPLRAADRKGTGPEGRPWPLVLAGGCCTMAAEPLTPFVDAMCLGEAEESFPELLTAFEEERARGASREDMLLRLSAVPGVYVPEFFQVEGGGALRPARPGLPRPTRRVAADLDLAPYPLVQPLPLGAVHNRLSLEIARGCTRGCRFCQAGMLYRPVRERSVDNLREIIDKCLKATGHDDLSFLSLSSGDFSALGELFQYAADRCATEQISLSLPSLRVGSVEDGIIARMAGIRRTGATLAPEAGSARLRAAINKGVTEEDLVQHVRRLLEHGWRQVKLYFMIGLPTETDEDLLAVLDLCRKARDAGGPGSARLRVTASLSPFVPKAHTPFQREAQISLAEMRRRTGLLLDAAKKEKMITVRRHDPEMSLLEGILARGDRRSADVVERAYRAGALFSSWKEGFSLQPWLDALSELGLDAEDYTRARAPDEALPWDHLASGVSENFLRREREKAVLALPTPDCRYAACNGCGVCGVPGRSSGLQKVSGREGAYRLTLNRPQRDRIGDGKRANASPPAADVPVRRGRTSPGNTGKTPVDALFESIPSEGISSENILSENILSEDILSEDISSESDLSESVPCGGIRSEGVPVESVLSENIPSENVLSKDIASEGVPSRGIPSGAAGRQKPPELPEHLVRKAAQILVRYSRLGPAAYLSQLEIQRIFDRALRRAGLPMAFSRGFHPLPLLSFGRALPVGVESESEWFSLYLRAPYPAPDAVEALNAGLPAGLTVLSADPQPLARQSADAERESFRLECLDSRGKAFAAAWERVGQSSSLPWLKEGKKGVRSLDARPFFVHIGTIPSGGTGARVNLVLDWSAGYVSPPALCIHVLDSVGFKADPAGMRMIKTRRPD
ncbi:MAG: TIGR03960 family B12-binding radical SAM protein [Desulfovibrio sp.]|jgi:radical SAM family uncharacterized protein/radical SAM-linked protein|nr:TIGR03960 family B12-binding radical SAM protein [Desulfovibrio sp.]